MHCWGAIQMSCCPITLAALWLRLQSPSVTSDLLQDAVQRAVCLPAAQLITQPSDGMAELLSSDE